MKKISTIILISFLSWTLNAQITVNAYDLNLGDVVLQAVDNNFQTDLLAPGEDLMWDFSGIHGQRTDTLIPIDPATTNHASSFPESNLAFGTPELALYMSLNSEAFANLGAAGMIDSLGMDLELVYSTPDTAIRFPINYENTSNTMGWGRSETVTFGEYTGKISRSTHRIQTCDAWGTLTTPISSYEVLRVQEQVITIDSVFVVVVIVGNEILIPIDSLNQYDTLYNYNFYSNDPTIKFPLVEVNYDPSDNSIIEAKWLTFIDASTPGLTINNRVSIFPNPSSDFINITTDTPLKRVHIYDLNGKLLKSSKQNNISVSDFPNSIYYIKIETEASTYTEKFIKQ